MLPVLAALLTSHQTYDLLILSNLLITTAVVLAYNINKRLLKIPSERNVQRNLYMIPRISICITGSMVNQKKVEFILRYR